MSKIFALLGFLIAAYLLSLPALFLDPVALINGNSSTSWQPLINLNHNAYHMWRTNDLTLLVAYLLSSFTANEVLTTQLLTILCGTFLVLRQLSPKLAQAPVVLWLASALPTLAVIGSVGRDPFVLGALAWAPLLAMMLFALINACRDGYALKVLPLWFVALFVSIQNASSANQAALPTALFALVFAHLVLARSSTARSLSMRAGSAILALALLPALWVALTAPAAPLPNYPERSHVIPTSGEGLPIIQLIGPHYPLQVLDHAASAALYAPIAAALSILALLALLALRKRATDAGRSLLIIASISALIVACDTILPKQYALISPLASLSRMLAWGEIVSLTSLLLGASAWLIAVAALMHPLSLVGVPIALCAICGTFVASSALRSPILSSYAHRGDLNLDKILLSPSASVLKNGLIEHPLLLDNLKPFRALSSQAMQDSATFGATYELTPLRDTSTALDSALGGTRLYTGRGHQFGDELLTIRFPAETTIQGIEISPGSYATDFPRGVLISGGECDEAKARSIITLPAWQGALLFTRDGYPYRSEHHDVRILFNHPEALSCLFVRQTAQTKYDWSIAQIKILGAPLNAP